MENQGQTFARLYHQALLNPQEVSVADFQLLLSKYPYSQPLHFALERRKFLGGELTKLGNKAILLADSPNWLYDYVQMPVKDAPLVGFTADDVPAVEEAVADEDPTAESVPTAPAEDDVPAVEEAVADEEPTAEAVATTPAADDVPVVEEAVADEDSTGEAVATTPAADDVPVVEEAVADEDSTGEAVATTPAADDAPADHQIAGGDTAIAEALPEMEDVDKRSAAEADVADQTSEDQKAALETLVQEGIGGGDYFALQGKEIRWETNVGLGGSKAEATESADANAIEKEEDVSLYNDELMPYSFRWWLHKTRLEYADTYQPFASPLLATNKKSSFDPVAFDKIVLDQQIREHIIHLQEPEDKLSEDVKQRAVGPIRVDKTSSVIEKFIREEPQIQPPPADQLNMENKARKSSEEQYDLVTETLANIYAGQGMYVKAIEVYKKLILKFPEKKSYFATQIQALEEKLY
ncbi:hypothetical protein [Sphingobacterium griseoflavum]|nr:hypothetical protein [Sphingobacterium griseoflavum]